MPIWDNAKDICLWGYGAEGKSVHRFLSKLCPDANFTVMTDHPEGDTQITPSTFKTKDFDLVVKSPGISLYHPLAQDIAESDTPLTSATNLWFEAHPDAKTLIITGTKGKSTCASLLYHLLRSMEKDVVLAGNIGVPLLDRRPAKDLTIIELSSYQLADLHHTPTMMAITNLYPEHTPWHNGSTQQYYDDKTRGAREGTFPLLTTRKNEELLRRFENRQNLIWFDDFQLPNTLETPRSLRGDHSKENIKLCLSILDYLSIDTDCALTHLSSFNGLSHRLEELGKRGKYVFVNDSISTIPETTIAALSVYQDRPICLILGGQDRGQDYTKLGEELLKYNIQKIYLLPENAKKIINSVEDKSLCEMCDSLEEAMEKIKLSDMEEDTIVLLSPAAPSYCQFKNFEERGNLFKALAGF
tara:strand:- start:116 stop:1357 length:1242 start_codon:yes stop_codon:yes gene_type:complete